MPNRSRQRFDFLAFFFFLAVFLAAFLTVFLADFFAEDFLEAFLVFLDFFAAFFGATFLAAFFAAFLAAFFFLTGLAATIGSSAAGTVSVIASRAGFSSSIFIPQGLSKP